MIFCVVNSVKTIKTCSHPPTRKYTQTRTLWQDSANTARNTRRGSANIPATSQQKHLDGGCNYFSVRKRDNENNGRKELQDVLIHSRSGRCSAPAKTMQVRQYAPVHQRSYLGRPGEPIFESFTIFWHYYSSYILKLTQI